MNKKVMLTLATTVLISASLLGCTKQASNNENASATATPVVATPTIPATNNDAGNESSTEGEASEVSYYGQWKINKAVAFAPVGTYSTEDIEGILTREVTFTETSATGFGDSLDYLDTTINNPTYTETTVSKADFEENYRVTFEQLGLTGDSVVEVVASDEKDNRSIFFIKDENTLLLYGGGAFLELVRM